MDAFIANTAPPSSMPRTGHVAAVPIGVNVTGPTPTLTAAADFTSGFMVHGL